MKIICLASRCDGGKNFIMILISCKISETSEAILQNVLRKQTLPNSSDLEAVRSSPKSNVVTTELPGKL